MTTIGTAALDAGLELLSLEEEDARSTKEINELLTRLNLGSHFEQIINTTRAKLDKKRDFFTDDYVNDDKHIEALLKEIERCVGCSDLQSPGFIGLVQASMMGKTRLMIEVSRHRPLILIRLDSTLAFPALKRLVENQATAITSETGYEEWRRCNRRIMQYIQSFFMVHHIYALQFHRSWSSSSHDYRALNASLLNGGQECVKKILNALAVSITEAEDDKALATISERLSRWQGWLSKELSAPVIAVDECHVPARLRSLEGVLFHSLYDEHKSEDLLAWHRYERGFTSTKPANYPYPARTTLNSGFRWVLQDYLNHAHHPQVSIFASTYFTAWEPLLDASKFSRSKAVITPFVLKQTLHQGHLVKALSSRGVPQAVLNEPRVRKILQHWCGRPGFFYATFLRFLGDATTSTLIVEAHDKARKDLFARLFQEGLNKLGELAQVGDLNLLGLGVSPVSGTDILRHLYLRLLLHGGNVSAGTSIVRLPELIQLGFAIISHYNSTDDELCRATIQELLVRDYFVSQTKTAGQPLRKHCDMSIATRIGSTVGTEHGQWAEYAMANQIIHGGSGASLANLLRAWGCNDLPTFIGGDEELVVRANDAASLEDLGLQEKREACLQQAQDRMGIIFPPSNEVLPDLIFFATNERTRCLVTVQSKAVKQRLSPENFLGALRSTSIHHLLDRNKEPQTELRNGWFTSLKPDEVVKFVRVIVCTAGFTKKQLEAVAEHNKEHAESQPIFLVGGTSDKVFGELSAIALSKKLKSDQPKIEKGRKELDRSAELWLIPNAYFFIRSSP